jgi:heat shock protein HslJ
MKTHLHAASIIILALCAIVPLVLVFFKDAPEGTQNPQTPVIEEKLVTKSSPRNIGYTIEGQPFLLVDGRAEVSIIPDSASMTTVMLFGEPVYGDLDNDGDEDAAVLLTYSTGGSGTFFYAALALKTGESYVTTNTLLLGDRIAPQTIEIHEGRAVYNYAERRADEPMTVPPSVGKSLWIQLDAARGEIGEWVKDFEGEADTAKMNLQMKTWEWVESVEQGEYIIPKKKGMFTLTFTNDGRVSVGTDCNSMGGSYTTQGSSLTFGPLMSTLMFCEDSQETLLGTILGATKAFNFTSKGTLELQYGEGGVATFR